MEPESANQCEAGHEVQGLVIGRLQTVWKFLAPKSYPPRIAGLVGEQPTHCRAFQTTKTELVAAADVSQEMPFRYRAHIPQHHMLGLGC